MDATQTYQHGQINAPGFAILKEMSYLGEETRVVALFMKSYFLPRQQKSTGNCVILCDTL